MRRALRMAARIPRGSRAAPHRGDGEVRGASGWTGAFSSLESGSTRVMALCGTVADGVGVMVGVRVGLRVQVAVGVSEGGKGVRVSVGTGVLVGPPGVRIR